MKTHGFTTMLAICILPLAVCAGDSTTNAGLATVAAALRPILDTLDPPPAVDFPEYSTSLVVAYRPQTYKIHRGSMTGQFSTNAYDEVGPGFKGFILRVHLQPEGEVNQACTPQTIREPYWLTDLDVTPIGGTDSQVFWGLSYMSRTPTNVLAAIRAAIKELERDRNSTPSHQ